MDSDIGATATLVQQQHQTLDGNHHQGQKEQDNVNTVASSEGHAVDKFRGEAGCSAKEIAVVAPDNDSVGDFSTQCSDVIDHDNEEEETDVEESGAGGWIMNPPISTIVQQHQAFDTTNGYIALPNPDSSNFSDVRVKDSSNVHLGNEVNYNGPITINQFVYTNPTPNQDAIELDVSVSENTSNLSTNKENKAPNGCIFPQNTKLNKVKQLLWTWKRAVLSCVLTLMLLTIVVPITLHFIHQLDASVSPEIPTSSIKAILCKALAAPSIRSECRYDDEWISCKSPVPPRTKATLSCENSYEPKFRTIEHLLSGQGWNVRCKANGEWEPEPMRCIPACGILPFGYVSLSTISGSFQSNIMELPWHASMHRDEPGEPKKYFCGASIIQDNLLITAAHCVYDENNRQPIDANKIYILAGNLFRDYNSPFHNPNLVQRNQVKRIYIARDYLGYIGNYMWDIAVLELVTPFVLSSYLVPACIDTSTSNYGTLLEPGTYGKVTGFRERPARTTTGESSAVLQALTVPVISFSQCRSASQSVNTEQYITKDKFCTGYTNGSSVCGGDGLVFKTVNNMWYLRGIVSVSLGTIKEGGSFHCNYNLYSLYTKISEHIFWIQDVIMKIEQNQTHTLCSEQSSIKCS